MLYRDKNNKQGHASRMDTASCVLLSGWGFLMGQSKYKVVAIFTFLPYGNVLVPVGGWAES
jgi:hypothetical protein